jgi:hypothetical protein
LATTDYIAIGLDHYKDHAQSLSDARKSSNHPVLSLFRHARDILIFNAIICIIALVSSPLKTWVITGVCMAPAILWNTPLFQRKDKKPKEKIEDAAQPNGFVIKRVPGMKAVFIGIIRGCGTFAVISSVMSQFATQGGHSPFTPTEMIIWSSINRFGHAVMADVRDYHEDLELKVPTIPVLLKSVFRAQMLLTTVHLLTMLVFFNNVYIVFGCLYATAFVWLLNEHSPRVLYRLSSHSQTIVAALYGTVQGIQFLRGQ